MLYDKTKQRERLLQILSEAPTEILLNAVEDFKAFKCRQVESMTTVFKYFGDGKQKAEQLTPTEVAELSEKKAPPLSLNKIEETSKVKFINPPGEPSAKIGGDTESAVLAWLRNGPADLDSLAVAMKRPSKTAETLLARLHQKGKIKYRSDKLYCLS